MIEKEGAQALLLAEDLSQGEEVCKKIVDQARVATESALLSQQAFWLRARLP
jgi:hypothetical protein